MDKLEFAELAWDMLESMGGAIIVDPQGKILFASKNYANFFKKTQEELIGRPLESAEVGDLLMRTILFPRK